MSPWSFVSVELALSTMTASGAKDSVPWLPLRVSSHAKSAPGVVEKCRESVALVTVAVVAAARGVVASRGPPTGTDG